jgi:hypothetical protein
MIDSINNGDVWCLHSLSQPWIPKVYQLTVGGKENTYDRGKLQEVGKKEYQNNPREVREVWMALISSGSIADMTYPKIGIPRQVD